MVEITINREIAALERMSPKQLRERYAELFGETTRTGNRIHLVKRIAWRIQANAEGGLSERAHRRAEQLARDADVRLTAPRGTNGTVGYVGPNVATRANTGRDDRLPPPGTVLTRAYKGTDVRVAVLERGFEFDGEQYKSLSAVAKAITGSHQNGYLFFRLGDHAS